MTLRANPNIPLPARRAPRILEAMTTGPARVERYGNVFRIPPGPGRVIISTDIHGHLEDFRRVAQAFERWLARGDAYLIYTGDLVHGPCYERTQWPEHLGDY